MTLTGIHIAGARDGDRTDWLALRIALWPHADAAEHAADISAALARPQGSGAFIARSDGEAVGFAEASLRHDFVNGCDTSPVAFLEGIYVAPAHRRLGVARSLCAAVEAWGRERGCSEFASDTRIENTDGQGLHVALGFEETQRVVYYRKVLK